MLVFEASRCDLWKIGRTDQAEAAPASYQHQHHPIRAHPVIPSFKTWPRSSPPVPACLCLDLARSPAFGLQDDQRSARLQQQWPAPAHQILHNLGLSPLLPALVQNSQLTHLPGYPNTTIPNRANIPPSRSAPIQRLQFPPPPTTPLPRRRQLNRALRCAHPNNLPHLRHALVHHDLHLDRVPARPD